MIKKNAWLLAGIIILLFGCSNSSFSQQKITVTEDERYFSKNQNKEANSEVNSGVETELSIEYLKNESHETRIQSQQVLTTSSLITELTEEENLGIKLLSYACVSASSGSMEEFLVDQKMLESSDLETKLMMQTQFIRSVYNGVYADEAKERLVDVVEMINEDEMVLTEEQLYRLLEMAGAKPAEELESFEYLNLWYESGFYRMPKFYSIGELYAEIDLGEIKKMKDGRVSVSAVLRVENDFGKVESFIITLVPNVESVFQFSVENIRAELIHPDGTDVIGTDILLQEPYTMPDHMSENPFDYIFELDGTLYQMPFPAGELERYGWSIEEQGSLEAGGRKKVYARKKEMLLTIGLWNYNTISSELKDCQVVWLKTGWDQTWNDVNFKLSEGVSFGQSKVEVESLYHDYLNPYYTSYNRRDALYKKIYGYDLYFENDMIKGFEMGYAPIPADRHQRIQIMIGDWKQDTKTEVASGVDFEMELNHIYQVDIDGDQVKEAICVKKLGGVQWAGDLCVLIDGEMVYVVKGLVSDQVNCQSMKMVVENGQYFFEFAGEDYANEVFRKIRVEKGWSKEVAYGSH